MRKITVEMTGSPKPFGFKTKEQFIDTLSEFGVIATKITHDPDYLITNDLSSNTNKMLLAKHRGIPILTYGQLIDKYRLEMRRKKLEEIRSKMDVK
jgi:hypothetical protein